MPKDASVTASDTITITAENTVAVTFDFDANLTVGTLKIAGDGEIVFTKSNDAAVTITDLDLQDRTAQVTFKDFVPSMTNVKPKEVPYNTAIIASYPYAIADGSQITFDLADDTAITTVFCPSAMASRVMRFAKKGAGVLTVNGQSYNKGIWTVEAGAIKQGNGHAGSGSQAWGGPFGRMSTDAYGTAGPIRRSTVLMWIVNLRSCSTRLTSSCSSPIRRRSRRSARAITTAR